MENNRPKILIIYTGGTIGMIENPVTRTLLPFDFSHLMENVPKVKLLTTTSTTFSSIRQSIAAT